MSSLPKPNSALAAAAAATPAPTGITPLMQRMYSATTLQADMVEGAKPATAPHGNSKPPGDAEFILPPPEDQPNTAVAAHDAGTAPKTPQAHKAVPKAGHAAGGGNEAAQAGGKTQTDPRLAKYRVYRHEDDVACVYAENSQCLRCGDCGARFEANGEFSLFQNSVAKHLKTCKSGTGYNIETLGPFLEQVNADAKLGNFLDVPFDFEKAIEKPLPASLRCYESAWCLDCGKTSGKSRSTKCSCVGKRRVKIDVLVGLANSRLAPIPIGIPRDINERKIMLSALYPDQELAPKLATALQEITVLKSKQVKGDSSAAVNSTHVEALPMNPGLFNAASEKASANPPRSGTTSISTQFENRSGFPKHSQTELKARYASVSKAVTPTEKEIRDSAILIGVIANSKVDTESNVLKSALHGLFGTSEHAGAVHAVRDNTLKGYSKGLVKLALALYRSETPKGKAFSQAADAISASQYASARERLHAMSNVVLVYMHINFLAAFTKQDYDDAMLLLLGLLIQREGKQTKKDDDDDDDDDDDGASDADEDEEATDERNIVLVSFTRASSILAGLRWMLLGVLVVGKDIQTQFSNHLDFVAMHSKAEFPRQINSLINLARQLNEQSTEDRNTVILVDTPSGVNFIVSNKEFTLKDVSRSARNVRDMLGDEIFPHLSASDKLELVKLFNNEQAESDYAMTDTNGCFTLSGKGWTIFRNAIKTAMDTLNDEGFKRLSNKLRQLACLLLTIEGSAVVRPATLARLYIDPVHVSKGSLKPRRDAQTGDTFIEIDALSTKHRGEVNVRGYLNPSASKILAFTHLIVPEMWTEHKAKPYLQEAEHFDNHDKASYLMSIRTMAASNECELYLRIPDANNLDRFDEASQDDAQQLLPAIAAAAFPQAFLAYARAAFDCSALTLGALRKFMVTYRGMAAQLLMQVLEHGNPSAVWASNAKAAIKTAKLVKDRPSGFGDGAAHSRQTSVQYYMGHMQGTSWDAETHVVTFLLYISMELLVLKLGVEADNTMATAEALSQQNFTTAQIEDMISSIETSSGFDLISVQRETVTACLNHRDMILSIALGTGKTWTLINTAKLQAGVTALVVPTKVLAQSIQEECIKLEVGCLYYTRNSPSVPSARAWDAHSNVKVVVVVWDTAVKHDFFSWLWGLTARGLLNRVVIDEAHMVIESSDFRDVTQSLSSIRGWCPGVPITLMSGTMTSNMMDHLEDEFQLADCERIAQSLSFRMWSNLNVYRLKADRQSGFQQGAFLHIGATLTKEQGDYRAIIFVTSKAAVKVGMDIFRVKFPDAKVRGASSDFTDQMNNTAIKPLLTPGEGRHVLFATPVVSQGVNLCGITSVFCVEAFSVMSMSQQFGRTGRGGSVSGSVTYFHWEDAPAKQEELNLYFESRNLNADDFNGVMGRESLERMIHATLDEGACVIQYLEQQFGNNTGATCDNCASCCGIHVDVEDVNCYKRRGTKSITAGELEQPSFGDEPAPAAAKALLSTTTTTTTTTTPQQLLGQAPSQASALAAAGKRLDFTATSPQLEDHREPKRQLLLEVRTEDEKDYDAYTQLTMELQAARVEQCLVCSVAVKGNHFHNHCQGLVGIAQTGVYCNYCFEKSHKRTGTRMQEGCCDPFKQGCKCYRLDCTPGRVPKLCDTFETFRNVLVWLWFGHRARLLQRFAECKGFKAYKELFVWATTGTFAPGRGKPPQRNLVRVVGHFIRLKGEMKL